MDNWIIPTDDCTKFLNFLSSLRTVYSLFRYMGKQSRTLESVCVTILDDGGTEATVDTDSARIFVVSSMGKISAYACQLDKRTGQVSANRHCLTYKRFSRIPAIRKLYDLLYLHLPITWQVKHELSSSNPLLNQVERWLSEPKTPASIEPYHLHLHLFPVQNFTVQTMYHDWRYAFYPNGSFGRYGGLYLDQVVSPPAEMLDKAKTDPSPTNR